MDVNPLGKCLRGDLFDIDLAVAIGKEQNGLCTPFYRLALFWALFWASL